MRLPRTEMKRARIEIIPMIDTIFFLLVFFMITSLAMIPMSAHRVTLPSSQTADLKPTEKVVVSLSKEGNYYVDQQKLLRVGDIKTLVSRRLSLNPNIVVVINCDKSQPMPKLTEAFDLIKQANAQNVMIATDPQSTTGAAR